MHQEVYQSVWMVVHMGGRSISHATALQTTVKPNVSTHLSVKKPDETSFFHLTLAIGVVSAHLPGLIVGERWRPRPGTPSASTFSPAPAATWGGDPVRALQCSIFPGIAPRRTRPRRQKESKVVAIPEKVVSDPRLRPREFHHSDPADLLRRSPMATKRKVFTLVDEEPDEEPAAKKARGRQGGRNRRRPPLRQTSWVCRPQKP